MKLFTMLFCTALATIWAIPVSALDLDEKVNVDIDFPTGGLQTVRPESLWITDDPQEFLLFDASSWRTRVELTNAEFPSGTGTLAVTGYDSSDNQLFQVTSFGYIMFQPNPGVSEYFVQVNPIDVSNVNALVHGATGVDPDTTTVGLMPIIPAECISMDDVEIEADFVYNGSTEASDYLFIDEVFACP